MATTTPDRVTVQPAGVATCDVCQGRVDTSSTVTFADGTYSRRCSTHDDAKFDRAGVRRPLPATDIAPNTRVRLIGSQGYTGTFIRYYAPMPSGKRNVEVRWDRADVVMTVLETQIEAI
ncbi:hypothetical protein [Mycolicibacterium mageritense]|uniref:hypothetical protein n=1 Tax=Mycolicibacterium mageritense TaxID=53462 RepID=UPI001E466FEB|nr:hypothetical protein [Mycolicibacterium mageritense]MCC9181110.1 hypothetical protein [Mycolicibacterium mageritense]